jgi:hypothetical protein
LTSASYTPDAGDPTAGGVITVNGVTGYTATINVSGDYVTGTPGNYTPDTVAFVSDNGNNNSGGFTGFDVFFSQVCFLAGTRILTPTGNVAIEALAAGDEVIALIGDQRVARPVKWIGYRKLILDERAMAKGLSPIRIRRDAIADGRPARDLLVSPPHGIFLDGKLIPAKLLINDMTIVRETAMTTVEYYHVELDRHAVIFSEELETESYLDMGNRAFFSNAGLAMMLHPEFHVNAGMSCWETDACAPLAVSATAVGPVWHALAARAVSLGHVPPSRVITTEADIHLLADGRRVDAIAVAGKVHSFMVPGAVRSLVLASRSATPCAVTPYLDEPRTLGVAVSQVTLRGRAGRTDFPPDHPAFARGWHAAERADRAIWRWTDGRGELPADFEDGPVIVEVRVASTTSYVIGEAVADMHLAA